VVLMAVSFGVLLALRVGRIRAEWVPWQSFTSPDARQKNAWHGAKRRL